LRLKKIANDNNMADRKIIIGVKRVIMTSLTMYDVIMKLKEGGRHKIIGEKQNFSSEK